MDPQITVIIPVFNRSELLTRAVKSVQSQSYQDFQLLVVDDHSTENIQDLFPKHHLLNQGRGVSAARNTGLRHSSTPFVAFLDSDDEWLPTKLEKQMEFLAAHPHVPMVHTDEKWVRNGVVVPQKKKHQKSGNHLFERSTELCIISPSTTLFRRSLFDFVGEFDEEFLVCEDFDLWLRITARSELGFIDEALVIKHGGHEDQLSHQYHSMDLWRVRALMKQVRNPELNQSQRKAVQNSLQRKCEILLKGFEKHKKFEHWDEISRALADARQTL